MGERSDSVRGLLTAEQAAARLVAIVDARKPRYKYNLSNDAKLIDGFVTRLLPVSARFAINTRMYRLNPRSTPKNRATATAVEIY